MSKKSISSASPVSFTMKEWDASHFINEIIKRAVPNSDRVTFKFVTKTKVADYPATHKFYLDDTHFVYMTLHYNGEWLYIYIPDDSTTFKYKTLKDTTSSLRYSTNNRFYKGNHISLSYNTMCNNIIFHYTEYDDTFKHENNNYRFCDFKFTNLTNKNIKCMLCKKDGTEVDASTYFSELDGIFEDEEYDEEYKKNLFIFNILYNILSIIKNKKQRSKNSAKIRLRKEEQEIARVIAEKKTQERLEELKLEEKHRKARESAKAKKATTVLGSLDMNLLKLFGEEPTKAAAKKPNNTRNAKSKRAQ